MSPGRHVRTRLYFTSESHVHSLLSVFRYGGLLDVRCGLNTHFLSASLAPLHHCDPPSFLSAVCVLSRGKTNHCRCGWFQEEKDWQWKQATDYLSAVTELNYMTQIVIMLYEDNDKVGRRAPQSCRSSRRLSSACFTSLCCVQEPTSEERFHVELHFSPGVKGCEDEENVPLGFGFRPASSEVRQLPVVVLGSCDPLCFLSQSDTFWLLNCFSLCCSQRL